MSEYAGTQSRTEIGDEPSRAAAAPEPGKRTLTERLRAEFGALAGVGKAKTRSAAITALLDRDELVEVQMRANLHGAAVWKVWTRAFPRTST